MIFTKNFIFLLIIEYLLIIANPCCDLISYIWNSILNNGERKTLTSAGMVLQRCLLNYHAVQSSF